MLIKIICIIKLLIIFRAGWTDTQMMVMLCLEEDIFQQIIIIVLWSKATPCLIYYLWSMEENLVYNHESEVYVYIETSWLIDQV